MNHIVITLIMVGLHQFVFNRATSKVIKVKAKFMIKTPPNKRFEWDVPTAGSAGRFRGLQARP